MPTLIFVHGTGVRQGGFHSSFALVQKALAGRRGLVVAPCYWGDLGATLPVTSVPGVELPVTSEPNYEVLLWSLLYEDPLYELRILALREMRITASLGQLPPGVRLAETATAYRATPEAAMGLEAAGLAEYFEEARSRVVSDAVFNKALTTATEALAEYRAAIARAWIAEAIRRRRACYSDEPPAPAALRDATVKTLVEDLGGEELAFSTWAKLRILHLATNWALRSRDRITGTASPLAGDVLLYQSRGAAIRQRIRKAVLEAEPPVVLMAHSLGGIASVDLLVQEELPVDLLITVGSQAPFFHEIGALWSLERGQPLPNHFPKWINVFDCRDFLSYVSEKVFPGRAVDLEVDNGEPFPVSHSAYWVNDDFWVAIARELP